MMAQKMWHERHDSVALGMMKRWRREDEARLRKRLAELRARVIPVYFVEDAVGKPNVEAIALQDEMFELKAEIAAIERQLSYEPEAEEIHECHPVREFLKTARVVLVDLGRTTAMRFTHEGTSYLASRGVDLVHLIVHGPAVALPDFGRIDEAFFGKSADQVKQWDGGCMRSWSVECGVSSAE